MPLTSACLLLAAWHLAAPAQELQLPGASASQAPAAARPSCVNHLTVLARQKILGALPVGYRLRNVTVQNICVPKSEGRLQTHVALPDALAPGRNDVSVTFIGASKQRFSAQVQMDLEATVGAKAAVVMARGAEVKIIVRSENVTVQAAAIAQESAGLGESVQVLPSGGSRVIRGRVLDARTVEVML